MSDTQIPLDSEADRIKALGSSDGMVIPADAETSLQVMETVEGLIRAFLVEALAQRGRYIDGEMTKPEVVASIGELSAGMQAVFYGKSNIYHGTDWNTPERLGAWLIGKANAITPPAEDAVARLFNALYIEVSDVLTAIDSGATDETMLNVVVDEAVARYTAHILGVPPELLAGTP